MGREGRPRLTGGRWARPLGLPARSFGPAPLGMTRLRGSDDARQAGIWRDARSAAAFGDGAAVDLLEVGGKVIRFCRTDVAADAETVDRSAAFDESADVRRRKAAANEDAHGRTALVVCTRSHLAHKF